MSEKTQTGFWGWITSLLDDISDWFKSLISGNDSGIQKVQLWAQMRSPDVKKLWETFKASHTQEPVLFTNPVEGQSVITSALGGRVLDGVHKQHKGTDIAPADGAVSPAIKAAAPGIVLVAAETGGFGNTVVIGHADGSFAIYGHMTGKNMPAFGATVSAGQVIGEMGSTGHSTGTHLHFEVRDAAFNVVTPKIDSMALARGVKLNSNHNRETDPALAATYASLTQGQQHPKFETADKPVTAPTLKPSTLREAVPHVG